LPLFPYVYLAVADLRFWQQAGLKTKQKRKTKNTGARVGEINKELKLILQLRKLKGS